MDTKLCKKCGEYKPKTEEFFVFRKGRQVFESPCKICQSKKVQEYKKNNKEKVLAQAKEYRTENKESINRKRQEAYPKYKIAMGAYKENNKSKINEKKQGNKKIRYKNDVVFRLNHLVSSVIRNSINKNGSSFSKYLKYSILELKQHLESQFEPWMTWENHGQYNPKTWKNNDFSTWTWNIDHIIPQSKLLYTSMQDDNFKKCWALENLRPLSSKQNIIDGNKR